MCAGVARSFIQRLWTAKVIIAGDSSDHIFRGAAYDVPEKCLLPILEDVAYKGDLFAVTPPHARIGDELLPGHGATVTFIKLDCGSVKDLLIADTRIVTVVNIEDIPKPSHVKSI